MGHRDRLQQLSPDGWFCDQNKISRARTWFAVGAHYHCFFFLSSFWFHARVSVSFSFFFDLFLGFLFGATIFGDHLSRTRQQ